MLEEIIKSIRLRILDKIKIVERFSSASDEFWVFSQIINGNPDLKPNHERFRKSLEFYQGRNYFIKLISLDEKLCFLKKSVSEDTEQIIELLKALENLLVSVTPASDFSPLESMINKIDEWLNPLLNEKDSKSERTYETCVKDSSKRKAQGGEAEAPAAKNRRVMTGQFFKPSGVPQKENFIHSRLIQPVDNKDVAANEWSILQENTPSILLKINVAKDETPENKLIKDFIEVIALRLQSLAFSFTPIANLGIVLIDNDEKMGVAVEKMDLTPLSPHFSDALIKSSIDTTWKYLPILATVAYILNNVDFTWKNIGLIEQALLTCFDADCAFAPLFNIQFPWLPVTEEAINALPNITKEAIAYNWLFQLFGGEEHPNPATYPYTYQSSQQESQNRHLINRTLFIFSILPKEFLLNLCNELPKSLPRSLFDCLELSNQFEEIAKYIGTSLHDRLNMFEYVLVKNTSFCEYVTSELCQKELNRFYYYYEKMYPTINKKPIFNEKFKSQFEEKFKNLKSEAEKNLAAKKKEVEEDAEMTDSSSSTQSLKPQSLNPVFRMT